MSGFLLPFFTVLLVLVIVFRSVGRMRGLTLSERTLQNSDLVTALVLSCEQTGSTINQRPVMRLRLRLEAAGQAPREVSVKQLLDLGSIPRAGEQVYAAVDRTNPEKVMVAGPVGASATGATLPAQANPALTEDRTRDAVAISPELRENHILGIGTILKMEPVPGSTNYTVEIDSITAPRRTVSFTQTTFGMDAYAVGERAYLLIGKADPNMVALVPLSYTGGQKLHKDANRLDPLVLGPALLHEGQKGIGTVTAAEPATLHSQFLAKSGMQRWRLHMHIQPEGDLPPYDAEQTITIPSQDRVDRICHVGAQVPVRYDPNDPHTFSTDSIAMGYPDPYVTIQAAYLAAVQRGEVT